MSRMISNRYAHAKLGDQRRPGEGRDGRAGIFEAGNTAFDSEIWADVNQVATGFNYPDYSSVLLRANDNSAAKEIAKRIQDDRNNDLDGA